MTYTLFPHQESGAEYLATRTGTRGIFDGMGTGKTVTALEGVSRLYEKTGFWPRVLITAPPIALPMWQEEAAGYLSLNPDMVSILKTGRSKIGSEQVLVVSYAIAAKRAAELRDWLSGGVLIIDESHALKSHKAKRTKAIIGSGGVASGAAYTWMLTGTPITRWNDDVYPFLCRADIGGMKERLGGTSKEKFDLRYTVRQKRQWPGARWPVEMVVGNRNTDELAEWVYGGGLARRVDLEEVHASMPPLTQNRYEIELNADAELKAQLKEMERQSLADIKQQLESKEPALATVRRKLGLAKVRGAAAEISERVEAGQNVLVGAWHTEVIDELVAALNDKGYAVGVIDGRASAMKKTALQEAWNEGELDALVCQIAAAGVSLNLQHGGTQIIVVEEDWSPSIMDQFYARLWRYGQKKHVHVDTLESKSKLDKALGRISKTKEREHEKFNAVGRETE